jgi:hypothetical protein
MIHAIEFQITESIPYCCDALWVELKEEFRGARIKYDTLSHSKGDPLSIIPEIKLLDKIPAGIQGEMHLSGKDRVIFLREEIQKARELGLLDGSYGRIKIHECRHDENGSCDPASVTIIEWGKPEEVISDI